MGNWERIASIVGDEAVLVGSTAQGSTLLGPGRVRHGGNGSTSIGEPHGPASARVRSIVELFRRAGLDTAASDRVEQLVCEKHMINVGINAITALTGIRNGSIAEWGPAKAVCRAAVEEAVRVARAQGYPIGDGMVERVTAVAAATAVNRSSMGQDVDRMKRTEIDAINGAIVNAGRKAGISTPRQRNPHQPREDTRSRLPGRECAGKELSGTVQFPRITGGLFDSCRPSGSNEFSPDPVNTESPLERGLSNELLRDLRKTYASRALLSTNLLVRYRENRETTP